MTVEREISVEKWVQMPDLIRPKCKKGVQNWGRL